MNSHNDSLYIVYLSLQKNFTNVSDVINLNKERKRRARIKADETAAQNRIRYGRTKAQKKLDQALEEKARKELDGARRTDEQEPTESN